MAQLVRCNTLACSLAVQVGSWSVAGRGGHHSVLQSGENIVFVLFGGGPQQQGCMGGWWGRGALLSAPGAGRQGSRPHAT